MNSMTNILTPAVQLLILSLCVPIFGQESDWTGDNGIEYFDADNWTDGVPDQNVTAGFHLPGPYQVNIPALAETNGVVVTSGLPLFNGGGELISQLVNVESSLSIFGTETRLLTDSMTVGAFGLLIADGEATISVSNTSNFFGAGRLFVNNAFFTSDTLNLGHGAAASSGSFTATNGAEINSRIVRIGQNPPADSTALITVQATWQNDAFLVIGELGSGRIIVSAGAEVNSNSFIVAGRQNGSTGEIEVVGNDSQLGSQNSELIIGGNGTGSLNVSDDGFVYANNMFVTNGSTAQFDNGDGTFESDLIVSESEITVNDGSVLTANGTTNIGDVDGEGTVTVDNATLTTGSLNIGEDSTDGTLRLLNGAVVNAGSSPHIGPNGFLNINDSQFLYDETSGPFTIEGTLLATDSPMTFPGEVILTPTSSVDLGARTTFDVLRHNGDELIMSGSSDFTINSSFSGAGSFDGNGEVNFRGTVSPGNDSSGQPHASVRGFELLFQNTAVAVMSISGTTPGIEHDRFVASNAALIDGALLFLDIAPTVTLDVGAEIEILRCNSSIAIVGMFSGMPEGTTFSHSSGHEFQISYVGGDGNDIRLTVLDVTDSFGQLDGNVLTVLATEDDDEIQVVRTSNPQQVILTVNGESETFDGVQDLMVQGLAGNDTIDVDFPGAFVFAGDGNDVVTMTAPGGSQVFGGAGNDVITGGPGPDELSGGLGMDQIDGKGGADSIYGNSSDDFIDTNQNILVGGDGNDTIEGTSRVDMIDGGRGNDTIFGFQASDFIDAFHGSDFVDAGSGADTVLGGLGNDEIFGGPGNDTIFGQEGRDELFGGTGDDTIVGGLNDDVIFGQDGRDTLSGNEGSDELFGGNADDQLFGGTQDDFLNGNSGSDELFGQAGDDEFQGGPGFDLFNGGPGTDTGIDTGEAGEVSIEN